MYSIQEGKCYICQTVPKRLAIDHCHKTGEVRGLLCGNCNTALGMINDSAEILTSMLEYIRRHRDALPV